jgi:hypothetical protein
LTEGDGQDVAAGVVVRRCGWVGGTVRYCKADASFGGLTAKITGLGVGSPSFDRLDGAA